MDFRRLTRSTVGDAWHCLILWFSERHIGESKFNKIEFKRPELKDVLGKRQEQIFQNTGLPVFVEDVQTGISG